MQDHVWFVETLTNGKWYRLDWAHTRQNARVRAKRFKCPTRIRKFIAA